jgi:hypothetical protein
MPARFKRLSFLFIMKNLLVVAIVLMCKSHIFVVIRVVSLDYIDIALEFISTTNDDLHYIQLKFTIGIVAIRHIWW